MNVSDTSIILRNPTVTISLLVAVLFGSYLLLTSTTDPLPFIQWRYDAKRILQFVLLLLLFLAPAVNSRIRSEFGSLVSASPSWLKVTLIVIFLWGVISVLVNTQSLMQGLNSFSEVALLSALVLGVFVVAACRRLAGRTFDQIVIAFIAMTGLTVGVQELIGVLAAQAAGVDFNFRISLLHFSWPRFYNQVQSWTVPVLVALPVLFARHRLAIFLCAVVLGLQWYIMLMGGARGSVASLVAAFVIAASLFPQIRKRLFVWQLTGLVLGLLIYATVLYSFERNQEDSGSFSDSPSTTDSRQLGADNVESDNKPTKSSSSFFKQSLGRPMVHTSGRTAMWQSTIQDAKKHPLLGIGPMNYVCTSPVRLGHPHNFPLQLAAEWGMPVAIVVVLIVLILLQRVALEIRKKLPESTPENLLAGLLFTGILAAAFHANLSGIVVMPASQTTGLFVGGMLVGNLTKSPSACPSRISQWVFFPGLTLAVFLLVLGSHEIKTMKERSVLLTPGYDMWPRIWQDAKVCSVYKP